MLYPNCNPKAKNSHLGSFSFKPERWASAWTALDLQSLLPTSVISSLTFLFSSIIFLFSSSLRFLPNRSAPAPAQPRLAMELWPPFVEEEELVARPALMGWPMFFNLDLSLLVKPATKCLNLFLEGSPLLNSSDSFELEVDWLLFERRPPRFDLEVVAEPRLGELGPGTSELAL